MMAQTFIAEPSNERRSAFLSAYARKFNVRRIPVPMAAAQAYDATCCCTPCSASAPATWPDRT
jgi:branched-chain amino acid transport system substrate-binding protein